MSNFQPFNASFLSQDQEDLLMAALASNRPAANNELSPPSKDVFDFSNGTLESPIFSTPAQNPLIDTDFAGMTDQQFMDYLEGGNTFDDDQSDNEDSPPAMNVSENNSKDLHDKRKSVIEGENPDDENAPKRREGEEKQAKRPGRKPLTSEPTSKRKAQNRAAQRAFRERKERPSKISRPRFLNLRSDPKAKIMKTVFFELRLNVSKQS